MQKRHASIANALEFFSFSINAIDMTCERKIESLKYKCCYCGGIFIPGWMGSCHFDNFSCYLWLKFHQQEFISISVIHAKSVQKGHNSIDNALELCPFLH